MKVSHISKKRKQDDAYIPDQKLLSGTNNSLSNGSKFQKNRWKQMSIIIKKMLKEKKSFSNTHTRKGGGGSTKNRFLKHNFPFSFLFLRGAG